MVAVLLYHRQGIAWHIDREPIWNNALEWAAKNIRKAEKEALNAEATIKPGTDNPDEGGGGADLGE